LGSTRELKWKNLDMLKEVFKEAQEQVVSQNLEPIELDTSKAMYLNFIERMRRSYAVILVSIGDISPNMIMDAIRVGVPFIVTEEVGIKNRIQEAALFVNPRDPKDIQAKIVWLANPANRKIQAEKIRRISFTHSWEKVAEEIVSVWNVTKKK
jgi:glycosyltransferase involved in cell wall biosynthesis